MVWPNITLFHNLPQKGIEFRHGFLSGEIVILLLEHHILDLHPVMESLIRYIQRISSFIRHKPPYQRIFFLALERLRLIFGLELAPRQEEVEISVKAIATSCSTLDDSLLANLPLLLTTLIELLEMVF